MQQDTIRGEREQTPLYLALPQLVHRYFACCYVRLEKLDLYPGQVHLLLALREHAGETQVELSRQLHIKAPTVTVMLDKMERQGLVERRQDKQDKRKLRIYLTSEGTAITQRAHAVICGIFDTLMEGISAEELAAFRDIVDRMNQNLKMCTLESQPTGGFPCGKNHERMV